MAIQFDPTNMLAAMVGEEHGLTAADLEQGAEPARAALASFQKASNNDQYGFPHLPFRQDDVVAGILELVSDREGKYDTVCVVGIGGSALGAWALDCGLRGPHPVQGEHTTKFPRLVILDNVDPAFIGRALDSMTPKKTMVVVIAKSGSTAETVSTFLILQDWLVQAQGKKARNQIVVVTSEAKGELKALATAEKYRCFYIPENVGGRFSVLCPVGLVPAALIGLDIKKLLKGAGQATHDSWQEDLSQNKALQAARYHYAVWTAKHKPIQVMFPYSNQLWGTAFWFRQLWAESLGKAKSRDGREVNVGQTPVAALGTTDQHSQVQLYREGPNDKVYTFLAVNRFDQDVNVPKSKSGFASFDYLSGQSLAKLLDVERRSTTAALTEAQRPNCTWTLDKINAEHLGAFLQYMEFQTAFAGELLNIDAFDQEGVELGKKFTYGLMGREGFDEYTSRFGEYEKKQQEARQNGMVTA